MWPVSFTKNVNKAAKKFEKSVEENLKAVSLEKARFEVRIEADETNDKSFNAKGFDKIEFYFSANLGESVKPIAKVASGGELSRLMFILNTVAKLSESAKTMVFDEIDAGIGGRVAEAVGLKLKELSRTQSGFVRYASTASRVTCRSSLFGGKRNGQKSDADSGQRIRRNRTN